MPLEVLQSRPSGDPQFNEVFDRRARGSRFLAGEEIFAQEVEARRYYRLVAGVVRSTRLWPDGRRQIGEFYFPGDMFGLASGPRHLQAAEALTDCQVLFVERRSLGDTPEGAQIERLVWTITSQQLEAAQERMLNLARRNAYDKVAFFLLEIARRAEEPWASLPMCRQDIADYLGLTIETVSRMITQLQQDGRLILDGSRRFRIGPPRLRAPDLAA